MLLATSVETLDIIKLLLIFAVGGGLLSLGRWSSRLGAGRNGGSPYDQLTPGTDEIVRSVEGTRKVWPPSAEEVAALLPFDPSLGRLRIRKLYFNKNDVSPGPADPEVFADELNIEVYDPESDRAWWKSYFVATPPGLAKILREKSWRYLHAPEILVFPRYDLEEIRRAVVSRIVAEHEFYKGLKEEEEESL